VTTTRGARALLLATLAVCALAVPADAAAQAMRTRAYAELGWTGFTGGGEDRVTQVGLRVSGLDTRGPSLDFALAAWLVPAAIVTADLDLALPIALGHGARLAPRAGGSTLLFGGGGFGGAIAGWNVGVGLVLAPAAPVSLRADYTYRRFFERELEDEGGLQSLTLGISW